MDSLQITHLKCFPLETKLLHSEFHLKLMNIFSVNNICFPSPYFVIYLNIIWKNSWNILNFIPFLTFQCASMMGFRSKASKNSSTQLRDARFKSAKGNHIWYYEIQIGKMYSLFPTDITTLCAANMFLCESLSFWPGFGCG